MRNRMFAGPSFGLAAHGFAMACAMFVTASVAAAQSARQEVAPASAIFRPVAARAGSQPDAALDLPDAPGEPRGNSAASATEAAPPPEASVSQHDIEPGQAAPVLTPREKAVMGFSGAFSLFAAGGWIFASGYEQATNGAPNWGTDRGAYGQRLGDAALRGITEDILRSCVMVPLLREDPRYYRLGRGHKPLARVLYAVTRPLVARTDSGREIPNFALFSGNLAGSVLTNAYYPRANRSVDQTFATFGSGLAGAAIGDSIAEFLGPLFRSRLHLSR